MCEITVIGLAPHMTVMCRLSTLQAMGFNGTAPPQHVLHAGSNWNNGTNCGSQCRNANNYRWNTNTNIGTQFLADPGRYEKPNSYGMTKLAKLTPWLESMSLSSFIQTEKNTQQEDAAG